MEKYETLSQKFKLYGHTSKPQDYKTFFMLNSAENEISSADKYENANLSWHFHIHKHRKFHTQLN